MRLQQTTTSTLALACKFEFSNSVTSPSSYCRPRAGMDQKTRSRSRSITSPTMARRSPSSGLASTTRSKVAEVPTALFASTTARILVRRAKYKAEADTESPPLHCGGMLGCDGLISILHGELLFYFHILIRKVCWDVGLRSPIHKRSLISEDFPLPRKLVRDIGTNLTTRHTVSLGF